MEGLKSISIERSPFDRVSTIRTSSEKNVIRWKERVKKKKTVSLTTKEKKSKERKVGRETNEWMNEHSKEKEEEKEKDGNRVGGSVAQR